MRKVILYIAASVDHYIAKTDGDTAWLHSPELTLANEDYGYNQLIESIDTTLMGNSTYEQIMSFDIPFPYPDTQNYVFTRSKDRQDTKHVSFVSKDISSFVQALKAKEGKDIWLIGGGQINSLLINSGLVDELILSIIPIVLGNGIPLFDHTINSCKLNLESTEAYTSGLVQLKYTVGN